MANTEPPTSAAPPPQHRRRSSLSVSELLAAHRASSTTDTSPSVRSVNPAMTSAVTQAAQQPHARRLSITTLGLSGAGGGGSASTTSAPAGPASSTPGRSGSILDATGIRKGLGRHASISEHSNESAVVDDGDPLSPSSSAGSSGGGSMGRRLSSGAKAYRDVRTTSGGSAMMGGFGGGVGPQSPSGGGKSQGFNWSENLRNRAQRTSISAAAGESMGGMQARIRGNTASESSLPPPAPAIAAPAQAPAAPPRARGLFEFEGGKPDPMQERILRGQFHMD